VTTDPRRVPSEAEWKRLESGFGVLFLVSAAVAIGFILMSPFPAFVSAVLMAPPVTATGWVWIVVIRGRDADRLARLSTFAAQSHVGRRLRRRR
jgi:hypothetical protein